MLATKRRNMNRLRGVVVSLLLATSAALVGCGPPWTVIVATTPDPFVRQRSFAVLPIEFNGLLVGDKSEPEYLSEKDAESQASWRGDKTAMNEEYTNALVAHAGESGIGVALATGPGTAPFLIRPSVHFIEPGYYVGVASGKSEVRMHVQITAPDGRVLDEIVMSHRTSGSLVNPGIGHRLRNDAEGLGKYTADYIAQRVGVGG